MYDLLTPCNVFLDDVELCGAGHAPLISQMQLPEVPLQLRGQDTLPGVIVNIREVYGPTGKPVMLAYPDILIILCIFIGIAL